SREEIDAIIVEKKSGLSLRRATSVREQIVELILQV
ncbi:MAG: hypothetical protein QOF72_2197, partial [Blastocatellia bacterium]|nr:hypothetical protein [Blastocatellia bacterium]